jgi:TRAP-type C4-dicarboxylate transport system substrate-binding protein
VALWLHLDTLAEALRADNMRHHQNYYEEWEEATDQVKELWREKARRVNAELIKATNRRKVDKVEP